MPVIRVSWQEALEFCKWLSEKTGLEVSLPTEAQWEWACRAGAAGAMNYGGIDTDFSRHANLADYSIRLLAVSGVNPRPIANPSPYEDFLPKDPRFNDNARIMTKVGSYSANPWGLKDMHGNVSELQAVSLQRKRRAERFDGRLDAGCSRRVVAGPAQTGDIVIQADV